MSKRLTFLLSMLMVTFAPGVGRVEASSIIVNLDATVFDFGTNPLLVFLGANTYTVTPIGVAQGGLYDAWSPWSANLNCDANGEKCAQGFENSYMYFAPDIGNGSGFDGFTYATALQALSHGVGSAFTVTVPENVRFGLNDCAACLSDNRGGESLLITAPDRQPDPGPKTPEPASMTLLTIGTLGMIARRWRQRRHAAAPLS